METSNNIKPSEDEISLIDLLAVLLKHKKFIIILTLAGALGVLGFAIGSLVLPNDKSYYPNYYTPKAIVKINDSSSGGLDLGGATSTLSSLVGLSVKSGGSTYGVAQKYAKSNSFVDKVINKMDLIKIYELTDSKKPLVSARETFKNNLFLEQDTDSNTMEISYKSIDGKLAANIVNTVVRLLEETFKNMSTDENIIQKQLLEDQLEFAKVKIGSLEEQLQFYGKKYGIYDIKTYAEERATALSTLRSEFLSKEISIESYKAYSNIIDDPGLRQLKIERNSLKATIEKQEKGYMIGGITVPSEKDLPGIFLDYNKLSLEYQMQGKLYASLAQQYELIKLKTDSIAPKFLVYEQAVPPLIKSGPSRGKLCIIVTMAIFFLAIFGAFIIEFIGNIKKDPVEMAKLKGLKK